MSKRPAAPSARPSGSTRPAGTPRPSGLLFDEPPIAVNPRLARALGLSTAVVVQQLHYWISRPKAHVRTGPDGAERAWVHNTYESWAESIPVSAITIRRCLDKLRDAGVVVSHEFDRARGNRRLWWSLDTAALDAYVTTMETSEKGADAGSEGTPPCDQNDQMPSGQNDQTHVIKMIRPSDQNDQIYKEAETTTETTIQQQQPEGRTESATAPGPVAPLAETSAPAGPPPVVVVGDLGDEGDEVAGDAGGRVTAPAEPGPDLDAATDRERRVSALIQRGLHERIARRLERNADPETLSSAVAAFDAYASAQRHAGKPVLNPGALLRRAIEQGWEAAGPPSLPAGGTNAPKTTPRTSVAAPPPHPSPDRVSGANPAAANPHMRSVHPTRDPIASPTAIHELLVANGLRRADEPPPHLPAPSTSTSSRP